MPHALLPLLFQRPYNESAAAIVSLVPGRPFAVIVTAFWLLGSFSTAGFAGQPGPAASVARGRVAHTLSPDPRVARADTGISLVSVDSTDGHQEAVAVLGSVGQTNAGNPGLTLTASPQAVAQRGRPYLNATRKTLVADNGQLLRGPFTSTQGAHLNLTNDTLVAIKSLGCNVVHLYTENINKDYPTSTTPSPGYAAASVDQLVQWTRDAGLYLIITCCSNPKTGTDVPDYKVDFWKFYAPRYANETHVIYEIQNEPVAWGPPYLNSTTPSGFMDTEVACYKAIRAAAPNTPVLLFTYAVMGGSGSATNAVTDIKYFNTQVFGNATQVWTNEAIALHGYGGWKNTSLATEALLGLGYPCVMTEYAGYSYGGLADGMDAQLISEMERLGVSWSSFEHVMPSGVAEELGVFGNSPHFQDIADRAGLSWVPDYGTWPVARGPYGNSGQPRHTTPNFSSSSSSISGTLHVEAEDFDTGGQGVAYYDTTPGNSGGQYRPGESVDIETATDTGGGYCVGTTASSEWLEYTIWADQPGTYTLSLRYAATGAATVQVTCNGLDKTGSWALASTGGTQTWTTVSTQVFLEAGRQKLHLNITGGAPNLNWFEISPITTGPFADGTYKLVNRNSGLAMEHSTTGSVVVQDTYTGSNTQTWSLQHLGAGQYRVRSSSDNTNWNISALPQNQLSLSGSWSIGSDTQRYVVRSTGDGYYRIAPASYGFDLEVANQSMVTGDAVQTSSGYTGAPQQQWAILAPSAPGIPVSLTTIYPSGSGTQIYLSWSAVSGVTGYNIKRAATSGGPYMTIASGGTTSSFTDTTATAGVTYYYVVSAVAGGMESLNSNEDSAVSLAAWLRFDETSGTTASDSTGNGKNGTLVNNPTWATGLIGNAINLNGTNQYATLPAGAVSSLTDFTVAAWVYLNNTSTWARVFDFGTDTTNYMYLTVSAGSAPRFVLRSPSATSDQTINSSVALTTGTWTHIVVTERSGVGTIYINGSPVGTNTGMVLNPSSLGTTTKNYIGKSLYSSDPYLSGMVDDFRIYSGALSSADLQLLIAPPPVITSAQTAIATRDVSTFSYQIAASNNPTSFTASGLPPGLSINPLTGLIQGVPTASGTYSATVMATNTRGTGSAPLVITVGVVTPRVFLKFDDGSGTTAADSSGNAWNGTLVNGPTWVSGSSAVSNGALKLTASGSNYVTLPTGVVNGLTDFTVACWVKLNTVSTWSRIFDFSIDANTSMYLTPQTSGGVIRYGFKVSGATAQNLEGTAPLTAGAWTHVAVTHAGNTSTIYVNGTVVANASGMTFNPSTMASTGNNYLGKSGFTGNPYLDGIIDDFRIYGQALSADIIQRMASTLPTPSRVTAITGNGQIGLSWASVPGADNYSVLRSATSGGPYTVVASGVTGTNYTDPGLNNGSTYYYVVSAVNPWSYSAVSSQVSALAGQTFAQWTATAFPGVSSLTITGPSADPDNDGYSNLLEYYFGTSPSIAETQPMITCARDGSGNLLFTYRMSKNLSGVTANVQSSTDLVSWANTGIAPAVASDQGTYWSMRVTVPMGSSPKLFLRLNVTQP